MASQSDFTNSYSQMFADMFLQRYQAVGRLRGTVREMHGLVGDAYKLKYLDAVKMNKHGAFGSDIPKTNVTVTAPTITFEDYELKLTIDEFEQLNFNASALQGYAESHAKAIGRQEDQFVIDAVTNNAVKSVAAGGANMTVEKLREARTLLGQDEVDADEIYIVMHWLNMESLLGQTEYTSSIFNTSKPLVDPQGNEGPFAGFKIIVIGDRNASSEISGNTGGLYKDGNDIRTCIAFAKSSVTLGYRLDPQTRMVPVEQNARTETLSIMSAGAQVGDSRGVVTVLCDES